MTVERRSRRFSSHKIERSARALINASTLCALATVTARGQAHINHMYFAWSEGFEIFWFSDRDSVHSRNLDRNPSAAITIYDSHQVNGRPDRGIQLFGRATITRGDEAALVYGRKFPGVDPSGYTGYRFRPRAVKIFDERWLAPATLVTARVTAQRLAWVKTEVWVTV